jgi:anti-sigma regulatory factor (Ser/Thr protein kinase)
VTRARHFSCRPQSVTAARGFVRETLREQAQDLVDAAELMACELATNCVQHARTDFELAISDGQGEIRVEVSDAGRGRPTLRSPTALEPSGRGLRIVQGLSTAWGVVPGEEGTRVWFTLARGGGVGAADEPLRCSR